MTDGRESDGDTPATTRVLYVGRSASASSTSSCLEDTNERLDVTPSMSVEGALASLADTTFDCVVSEYRIADTDGVAFLKRVRSEYPSIPFVLYAAEGSERVASDAIAAGVTDYVSAETGETCSELAERITDAVEKTNVQADARSADPALVALNEASRDLMTATTDTAVAERIIELVETAADASVATVWLYEDDVNRLRPAASTLDTETLESVTSGSEEMAVFERGEIESFGKPRKNTERYADVSLDSRLFVPLGEYGLLSVGWETPKRIDDTTRELFETVCRTAEAAFERVQREWMLSELNALTQKLVRAPSAEDVARIATDAGSTLLNLPFTHVYLRDANDDVLRPAAISDAMSERFGDLPEFERGEGVFWDVLEAGDTRLYGDVQSEANVASDMPFRGAIIAALGNHGVFASGSLAPAEFDAFDRRVVSILVATTDAVLERLEREQRLREHEQELEAARDRFRSVFEHSNDAILVFDPEADEILEANPRASELLGYSREELLELGPSDIHPEEWDQFQAFVDTTHAEGSARTNRLSCVTKGGEQVPTEISASTFDFEGRSGVLAIVRDVSELREYERKLERQNERLESFAETVSHDLRNPLNVAAGYIGMERDENDSEALAAAHDALTRMDDLIEDILTLARQRQSDLELTAVALDSLTDACWQNVATADADLVVSTDMTVHADESRLQRVFENLFRNSIEHSESGVTIRVGELSEGDGFYVADTGPGIPAEERDTVFERGHTTSEDGTGFGLSIVREIVEAHGWDISVGESTDGGARFEITGVETEP